MELVEEKLYLEIIKELCADMIRIAMKDYQKPPDGREYLKDDAERWLNDIENKSTFSFLWCCDKLNLAPSRIRKGISEARVN